MHNCYVALQRLWNYPNTTHPDSPLIPGPDVESIISEGDLSIGGISENILDSSALSAKSTPIGPGIIETLQAQLKQREGELSQFKSERTTSQVQREKLAAEVVRLSALAEQVEELTNRKRAKDRQYRELEQKYGALLTLYGEKVEVVEELRLDLADVKQLLRQQTEQWAQMQTQ